MVVVALLFAGPFVPNNRGSALCVLLEEPDLLFSARSESASSNRPHEVRTAGMFFAFFVFCVLAFSALVLVPLVTAVHRVHGVQPGKSAFLEPFVPQQLHERPLRKPGQYLGADARPLRTYMKRMCGRGVVRCRQGVCGRGVVRIACMHVVHVYGGSVS